MAIAGALVAVALASAGVTAGVMAATRSSSSASAAAGGPGGGFGGGGFGGAGTGRRGGGALDALHGTYVVSDGNGSYTTELTQTGTVSAVSSSSITVKSTDGYTKAYPVGSSTSIDNGSDQLSSVATGHTVRIVADSHGSATTITDTNLTGSPGGPGGGQPGQFQGNGQ